MVPDQFVYDLRALIEAVRGDIKDDYRSEGCGEPSTDLTIGCDGDPTVWGYQTGDNSFTGGAYGYHTWAVVTVFRDSDPIVLASELINQLTDQLPNGWSDA